MRSVWSALTRLARPMLGRADVRLRLLCLALSAAALLYAAPVSAEPRPGFVAVQGTGFVLDAVPFRFLGANISVLHGERERNDYEAVLDAVVADGLKVVRLWALGEQPVPAQPHHALYAFRIGESGWLEGSFAQLDRVLAAAGARGLKVIVVLANRWKDYGGIATYLRWGGASVERDERGEPLGSALTAFFDCAPCQAQYREHVARVVGRISALTGVAYRDDPTIMAWELINEASAVGARDEEVLLRWVAESARLIRSIDARHLISAGHIGYQTSRERRVWRAVQSLPEVDFADAHLYPQTDLRVANTVQLGQLLDDPIALAELALHKPLVFGEFGFERAPLRLSGGRARWTEAFVAHFLKRSAEGALIWLYEPSDNPRRTHSISATPSDLDSVEVRRVLRDAAAQLGGGMPGAVPADWIRGTTLPEFAPRRAARSSLAAHQGFRAHGERRVLEIDPVEFAWLRFERAGVYDAHALQTVWGQGEGEVEYRFVGPESEPRALRIEARVSSELPGAGTGKDPRDGSDIEISLDAQVIGTVRAVPDDGYGEVASVELHDARLLRRLFRGRRRHTLLLRALPSAYAGGLCVYGAATGLSPVPPDKLRELSAVRITLL